MDPRVDVILPTHRRPHTIAYAITAVLRQTHAALALHVIGDGCDDATENAVRAIDDPRVAFYRLPKAPGYGYANRNRILRQTAAPYVAYASDDDLWFPDHLAHGVAALERGRLDLVATRPAHVRVSGEVDPNLFALDWRLGPLSGFLRNWFLGALTMVHRRSLFDAIGYWDEGLARFGDRELYARARVQGPATAYVDHVTVLRFYAQDWDEHYPRLAEPPQRRFLERLAHAQWCQDVRAAARPGPRSLAVRWHQWHDFARFARQSGPKFARFWMQRWRSRNVGSEILADGAR